MVGVYSNFLKTHFVKRKKINFKYTNSANPCVGKSTGGNDSGSLRPRSRDILVVSSISVIPM